MRVLLRPPRFRGAVADPKSFRSARTAWIGIVPKQHSSGGKNRLGNISKQGDRYLHGLFVAGAVAVIRYARSMAPNIGLGSRRCWRGGRRRLLLSRSPTRSVEAQGLNAPHVEHPQAVRCNAWSDIAAW
jgi:hypothetical protein